MVLGASVNTASRLQSIAGPATVLVDDVTRRASEAAIAYEDTGTHEVKGREQIHAWAALRVVARGRCPPGAGLEAPFVGRDRELQTIVDRRHDSTADGQARLVSVPGERRYPASLALWEFFKYIDGDRGGRGLLASGRCLSYGEGVAYWALAEMVRARAGILEETWPAAPARAARRHRAEFVTDDRDRRARTATRAPAPARGAPGRRGSRPVLRLAAVLRADGRPRPAVLLSRIFQWADSGLLDFIDYLLEWSADLPIFILTLRDPSSRPSAGRELGQAGASAELSRALGGLRRCDGCSRAWHPACRTSLLSGS